MSVLMSPGQVTGPSQGESSGGTATLNVSRSVFLNRRAASRYRALASIIPGSERFSCNLSFQFCKQFSFSLILWNPKYYRVYKFPPPAPGAEPDRSSPCHPPPISCKSILILYSFLRLGLSSGPFPSGFASKILYASLLSHVRATCPQCLACLPKNMLIGTVYTGCPRRNVPDSGRVFLMLKYTDITQNTYIQS